MPDEDYELNQSVGDLCLSPPQNARSIKRVNRRYKQQPKQAGSLQAVTLGALNDPNVSGAVRTKHRTKPKNVYKPPLV
jgi:hypothetical protein